jgi:pimeloyl-ACP methyl ester carboxylesterase
MSPNANGLKVLCLVFIIQFASDTPRLSAETWKGWNKIRFEVDGRDAFLIEPAKPARGNPWIWRTEFFGHEPQADIALLNHGFYVAYVDIQNQYGSPIAMDAMDAFYAHVIDKHGLSAKTVLEGFSRGGLYTFNWAARNPDKVACIYNDAPVCDFTSWPGPKGRGKHSPFDWERLKKAYGFAGDDQAIKSPLNPVNQLEPLAKAKIPLLHVCGAADDVVPIEENSLVVRDRYTALGGSITLISKPHCNHHPHSLKDPTRIVNFVLTHTGFADRLIEPTTPFGYDYFKLRDGLQRSYVKFKTEKKGRVAFLGGSITQSNGWRELVCEDLKKRFPDTEFDFVAAGISSLGSTPGAFRFRRDVLRNGPVDLLFEEAAVNDHTNGFAGVEQRRGMEGIVRQALMSNSMMDAVILHFVDPGKMAEINAGRTPEVTERIVAGEFTWEKDFKDLHPTPFGHALYARSIGRLFDAAWGEPISSQQLTARHLPEPLDASSYFYGRLVSPIDVMASKQATLGEGWKLIESWKPEGRAGTRPGFVNVPALVAEHSGATMKLLFDGMGIGLFIASGPDTGNIDYRIDQGEWRSRELFTQWSPGLHLPWAVMLDSELKDGRHELEFRVSVKSDGRSTGHAIRIIHFLVNDPE